MRYPLSMERFLFCCYHLISDEWPESPTVIITTRDAFELDGEFRDRDNIDDTKRLEEICEKYNLVRKGTAWYETKLGPSEIKVLLEGELDFVYEEELLDDWLLEEDVTNSNYIFPTPDDSALSF